MDPRITETQSQLNNFMEKYALPSKAFSRFSDVSEGLAYTILSVPDSLWNNVNKSIELLKKSKEGYLKVQINNVDLNIIKVSATEKQLTLVASQERKSIDTDAINGEFKDIFAEDAPVKKETNEEELY